MTSAHGGIYGRSKTGTTHLVVSGLLPAVAAYGADSIKGQVQGRSPGIDCYRMIGADELAKLLFKLSDLRPGGEPAGTEGRDYSGYLFFPNLWLMKWKKFFSHLTTT